MGTCLVTGGAGFLGSHLCDALLARDHRVICVDNLETGSLANIEHIRGPRFAHLNVDITEPYFVDEPVDFVYHFASPASPIDYLRLPLHTLKVGSYGTHHTLGLAKLHRARFLTASTSEVYGDPQVHPQPESYWGHVNPIGPRGVYDEAKRYAEALTMAYHRQQGVDTAIVRIFNSILADEQVLYDNGVELCRERVEDLAQRHAMYAVAAGHVSRRVLAGVREPVVGDVSAGVHYELDGFTVPAFDAAGQMVAGRVDALVAHPTDERCFEVRTRYGRSIKVTGHHSVFVEGVGGEPLAKPVEDLRTGDRIAIAGRIDVPERDRRWLSMFDVWAFAEGDPWELLVEAPGLGDKVWTRRFDVFSLLTAEKRNAGPNWRNGAWTKIIRMRDSDRVPLRVLQRIGEIPPPDAQVRRRTAGRSNPLPARIEITDDLLWLLGLYVAEGCWQETRPKTACVGLSADDGLLDRAQAIVERTFGLHVVRAPGSADRAPSMFVHSVLLLRLLERLGFGPGEKRVPGWILGLPLSRLKWFLEGYRQGDGVHSGDKVGVRHEFSTTSEALKDDLIVALARFGLVPSVGRYEYERNAFWRLTLAHVTPWSPLAWDRGVAQRLQARRTGDLVWAPVTEIVEIESTPLVYDFCVPGLENFWAGTGVMAHNTYGPRMRPHDGRAIPTFLRQALQNLPLTVFGDGSQTRSFCFVSDLIAGIIALAESGYHHPVNIGNPDEYTLLQLAEAVIDVTGSASEIVYEALPTDDPQVRQPDTRLAEQILGWRPEISLHEGLRRTIDEAGVDALVGGGLR
jgi:nucleoside-diphosphate-sugar epimerase/intein/homing endonuclease